MLQPWTSDLWNEANYGVEELGRFDPPPHIIATPFDPPPPNIDMIRVLPLPAQTPISFGHSQALLETVLDWSGGQPNHGVILIGEKLAGEVGDIPGDQHLHFLRTSQAITLRLTLDRR